MKNQYVTGHQVWEQLLRLCIREKKNLIKLTYKNILYWYSFQSVVVFNESLSDFHLPHTRDRMDRLFGFFFSFGLLVWKTKSARTTMKLKSRQEGFERFNVWVSHSHSQEPITGLPSQQLLSTPHN